MDYTKEAMAIKGVISAVLAFLTALWGWFGWLVIAWVGLMLADYLSGSWAARKKKEWSSEKAREGLLHKGGMMLVVVCAGVLDLVLGLIIANIPMVQLPFEYTVLICPLVVVWYIITELGSLLENAALLGAPLPGFLMKIIDGMKVAVTTAGDKLGGKEGEKIE